MKHQPLFPPIYSTGFSLIEVMISVLIFSLGIVGIIQLQSTSVRNNTIANQYVLATQMANDLRDRMQVNATAVATYYTAGSTALPSGAAWSTSATACYKATGTPDATFPATCSGANIATDDVREIRLWARQNLNLAQVWVCLDTPPPPPTPPASGGDWLGDLAVSGCNAGGAGAVPVIKIIWCPPGEFNEVCNDPTKPEKLSRFVMLVRS